MLGKLRGLFGRRKGAADGVVGAVDVDGQPIAVDGPDAAGGGGEERTLLEGELRAARKIQMGLVPKIFPPIAGCLPFDLYALLEPAREIGGDFYDFWLNGRENLMLVVGDVSGNGIPAALFMAVCRTYLRAFSRSVGEPARLLECLNRELSRHNETCMFATLVCGLAHIPSGTLRYASAGHNPPFLRRRDGSASPLRSPGAPPIGFMPGTVYETQCVALAPGDSVLLYSDGVPEAFNGEGRVLGEEAALALFRSAAAAGGCRAAIGQLRAEVSEFAGPAEQSDDITMLMYGQLDQAGAKADLGAGRDAPLPLESDTGILSLSGQFAPPGRLGSGRFPRDMGQTFSGLLEER